MEDIFATILLVDFELSVYPDPLLENGKKFNNCQGKVHLVVRNTTSFADIIS